MASTNPICWRLLGTRGQVESATVVVAVAMVLVVEEVGTHRTAPSPHPGGHQEVSPNTHTLGQCLSHLDAWKM